ncbi:chitin deacetylase [Mortierella claussenii]|nr:chitin deacetylase [Mortierella claussenii]
MLDSEYAAVVKRAHDGEQQFASHTASYADTSASGIDYANQMKMLDDSLFEIMRSPYGNTSPESMAWLSDNGYKVINWNMNMNDWRHPNDYNLNLKAYRVALQDPAAKSRSFIGLQHNTEQDTAQAFSKFAIEYVLSKGFHIMPVGSSWVTPPDGIVVKEHGAAFPPPILSMP